MHTPGVAFGRRERGIGTTVCVSGISEREKKTTLQGAFGEFGHIVRIEIPPGRSVAFVEFAEKQDAREAQECMDKKSIGGNTVTVRMADDRPPGSGTPPTHKETRGTAGGAAAQNLASTEDRALVREKAMNRRIQEADPADNRDRGPRDRGHRRSDACDEYPIESDSRRHDVRDKEPSMRERSRREERDRRDVDRGGGRDRKNGRRGDSRARLSDGYHGRGDSRGRIGRGRSRSRRR